MTDVLVMKDQRRREAQVWVNRYTATAIAAGIVKVMGKLVIQYFEDRMEGEPS